MSNLKFWEIDREEQLRLKKKKKKKERDSKLQSKRLKDSSNRNMGYKIFRALEV